MTKAVLGWKKNQFGTVVVVVVVVVAVHVAEVVNSCQLWAYIGLLKIVTPLERGEGWGIWGLKSNSMGVWT